MSDDLDIDELLEDLDELEMAEIGTKASEEVVEKPKAKPSGRIDPDQLHKDVAFNELELDNAMIEQASLHLKYGVLLSKIQRRMDAAKKRMEVLYAMLDREVRAAATEEKRKVTEKMIEGEILLNEDYQNALDSYHDVKAEHALAKSAFESFNHRRDMLTQVAKRLNVEREGELSVSESGSTRSLARAVNDRREKISA